MSNGVLTIWLEDNPAGATLQWPVDLTDSPLPPASSPAGAVHRLLNLGYYLGEKVEELTPDAASALREFQADNGLEPSGELDSKTAAVLMKIHGV